MPEVFHSRCRVVGFDELGYSVASVDRVLRDAERERERERDFHSECDSTAGAKIPDEKAFFEFLEPTACTRYRLDRAIVGVVFG